MGARARNQISDTTCFNEQHSNSTSMAMERFLTALVFCEAPLDGYGTSVMAPGAITKLVSGGGGAAKPAMADKQADAEKERGFFHDKSKGQRRAVFDLAFDGLNCFDTVNVCFVFCGSNLECCHVLYYLITSDDLFIRFVLLDK
uniref:Uncharacterized protein n=1 Tax=Avena sativa TaxID=4498 RepID=A0ACD5ZPD6_AVESA